MTNQKPSWFQRRALNGMASRLAHRGVPYGVSIDLTDAMYQQGADAEPAYPALLSGQDVQNHLEPLASGRAVIWQATERPTC